MHDYEYDCEYEYDCGCDNQRDYDYEYDCKYDYDYQYDYEYDHEYRHDYDYDYECTITTTSSSSISSSPEVPLTLHLPSQFTKSDWSQTQQDLLSLLIIPSTATAKICTGSCCARACAGGFITGPHALSLVDEGESQRRLRFDHPL